MIDAAIVMIENAHKHLERDAGKKDHWQIIIDASKQVGPALFFSLLIITLSFIPIFSLQAQEGRLFKPLAFTKTYSMAAAALLSVTLVPVMMGYFIRTTLLPDHWTVKKQRVVSLLSGGGTLLLLWIVIKGIGGGLAPFALSIALLTAAVVLVVLWPQKVAKEE
jgi:Cu/Ag efflux pump CusA